MASYTAEQFNSFKEKFQAALTDSSWLFGLKYDTSSEDGRKIFLADFRSHIWVSYRKNFAALMPSPQGRSLTSDTGWGCMIRSGQMMLAETLLRSRLGRGWRIDSGKKEGQEGNIPIMSIAHDRTILEFVDVLEPKCNFSIHRIVQSGLKYGKNPGDWYGPETISVVLRDLVNSRTDFNVKLHVAHGSLVITGDIASQCIIAEEGASSGEGRNDWTSELLLIVPLRLGLSSINEIYGGALCACLELPQSVGFIGGKPHHSVYFVGHQGKKLFYMDPHTTQQTVDPGISFPTLSDLRSYHTSTPRAMKVSELDPSLALGFHIKSSEDFEDFCRRVNLIFAQNIPIFEIVGTPFTSTPSKILSTEMGGSSLQNVGGTTDDLHKTSEEEDDWELM